MTPHTSPSVVRSSKKNDHHTLRVHWVHCFIIIHTYLKGTCCWVCVLRLNQFSQLSFIQYMELWIFSFIILLWWLEECVLNFIIISKVEAWVHNIVYGEVMKQWYVLYVLLCFYCQTTALSSQWESLYPELSFSNWSRVLGPDSIFRCHLTSIGNPIEEIRRS